MRDYRDYPTAIIHCPGCGVECNFVADRFDQMPFSYPGTYHPHHRGSRGCLERQILNLKERIEELTEEATGKKDVVLLYLTHRTAVVIANSPQEAIQRAHMREPDGGWEHATASLLCRIRATCTSRVLAMDVSVLTLEEIYHAGWAVIVDRASVVSEAISETELEALRRLRSALEPIQAKMRICNPYDAVLDDLN